LENSIFPSPIIIRPACGVCGRYRSLAGDPVALVNMGSEIMAKSGLFYGEFSERVGIDDKGEVLVEAGMPRQYPEMVR
jgi:hypothetical protein